MQTAHHGRPASLEAGQGLSTKLELISKIVTIFAVLVGGGWALYQFVYKAQEAEAARFADLQLTIVPELMDFDATSELLNVNVHLKRT